MRPALFVFVVRRIAKALPEAESPSPLRGWRWWAFAGALLLALKASPALADHSVTLVWDLNTSPDIEGYNIYYGLLSGVYTEAQAGYTNRFTVGGLLEGLTYYFAASAVNTAGAESDLCPEIAFTVPFGPPLAPLIIGNPLSQTVPRASSVTLRVTATGSDPKGYQWRKNQDDLLAATNSTLTLSGFQPGDQGAYSVVVSNSAGSATSQSALLSLPVPPSLALDMYRGFAILLIGGAVGQTCLIEYADTPNPASWQVLTSFVLSSNPAGWLDFQALAAPQRFYRVSLSP